MKKHILYIQLAKALTLRDSNRQHKMDSSKFNNRSECVIVINIIVLFEAFDNQTSFVAISRSIGIPLNLVDPLVVN
jgi:hypothetical protein